MANKAQPSQPLTTKYFQEGICNYFLFDFLCHAVHGIWPYKFCLNNQFNGFPLGNEVTFLEGSVEVSILAM